MSELSRDDAFYACMFKIMLWWRAKDVNGNEWEEAIAEGKRFAANLPSEIRTALAGGGGGEKPCDAGLCERHGCKVYSGPPDCPTCGAPVCCQFCCYEAGLESRLAAAEKRAEEAEEYNAGLQLAIDEQRKNMAGFIAERDDLKEELAQARTELNSIEGYWDERLIKERERTSAAESERDAALARVKELEAKQSSSVHIDMAGIYVDGVKYTPEQVRSVVRRLAAIRDAAGAQP